MRRSMAAWIPGSGEGRSPLAVPIRRSLGLPSAAPSENGLHQHSRHYRSKALRTFHRQGTPAALAPRTSEGMPLYPGNPMHRIVVAIESKHDLLGAVQRELPIVRIDPVVHVISIIDNGAVGASDVQEVRLNPRGLGGIVVSLLFDPLFLINSGRGVPKRENPHILKRPRFDGVRPGEQAERAVIVSRVIHEGWKNSALFMQVRHRRRPANASFALYSGCTARNLYHGKETT